MSMTDRELLEAAARAAGLKVKSDRTSTWLLDEDGYADTRWDPLTDDGDALRLAVRLGLTLDTGGDASEAVSHIHWYKEHHNGDPYAATRRAIVRAAAAMGGSDERPSGEAARPA